MMFVMLMQSISYIRNQLLFQILLEKKISWSLLVAEWILIQLLLFLKVIKGGVSMFLVKFMCAVEL